ncbi:MAG TPA: DsbC family protein [Steroidobacteraceae bacterium]|nr:DsbC family protein [Steroidobacteraceae bacterium]
MSIRHTLFIAVLLPLVACAQDSAKPTAPGAAPATSKPSAAAPAVGKDDPRVLLAAKIPGSKPEDFRATPVPGIFELVHGNDISYVSADAKYVFAGDMYRVSDKGDFPNLSETRRRELRVARLSEVPESQMLVFGPDKAEHTITVFTDVDCPWCRKLHAQIADYNKLGIRVRYMFFPRTGPDTESWAKADAVWCSADRKDAFTRTKGGEEIKARACAGSPVAREYKLGRDIGVTGTPGVILENGELIPGYLPPSQMLVHIRKSVATEAQGRAN